MLSDEIDSLGLFTAGLKPLQAYNDDPLASINIAGVVNHT